MPPPAKATDRRRAPPPADQRRRSQASSARRRSVDNGGLSGKKYDTSKTGGAHYDYTNKATMQQNYGGKMPQKASYGFSGKGAVKKNSKVKMAMMAGGALLGGAVVGAGAYYAYQRYKGDSDAAGQQSWCERHGTFYDCEGCRAKYGNTECKEDADCFAGGCSYYLADELNRDDLMATAFVPSLYKPPFYIRVSEIAGSGLTQADLKCDNASLELMKANYSTPMSFKPLLYVTLTALDQLEDALPAGASSGGTQGSTAVATADGTHHSARPLPAVLLAICFAATAGLPRSSLTMLALAPFIAILLVL